MTGIAIEGGKMPYAANIVDLTAHKRNPADAVPMLLLSAVLDMDSEHVVECEPGKAVGLGHGALFLCPDERAAAMIQVIRTRYKPWQWRFYQKSGNRWRRV